MRSLWGCQTIAPKPSCQRFGNIVCAFIAHDFQRFSMQRPGRCQSALLSRALGTMEGTGRLCKTHLSSMYGIDVAFKLQGLAGSRSHTWPTVLRAWTRSFGSMLEPRPVACVSDTCHRESQHNLCQHDPLPEWQHAKCIPGANISIAGDSVTG